MKCLLPYRAVAGLAFVLSLALLGACRSDRPDGVPAPARMEQVLYDYHLAQALTPAPGDTLQGAQQGELVAAVFAKYGMTEADFDRAMEYYTRHAEQLYEMYGHVRERFASSYEVKRGSIAQGKVSGDTLDLWQGGAAYLLSSAGENHLTYTFEPDSLLRSGDRLIWQFNTKWVYHDGAKSAAALLSVRYANDSTVTTSRVVYSTGHQELTLAVDSGDVRSVTCLLYQISPWTERPRLLIVTQPALIRVRAAAQQPSIPSSASPLPDSLAAGSASAERRVRDSLMRADTARRDHFQPATSPVSRGFRPN